MKFKIEAFKIFTDKWGHIVKTIDYLPNEWVEFANQKSAEEQAVLISSIYKKADVNLLAKSCADEVWCITSYKKGKEIARNKNWKS